MDLAASIQKVTEEIMLRLSRTLQAETGSANLCLAGGVALNCVGNGRLLLPPMLRDKISPKRREKLVQSRWDDSTVGNSPVRF